VAISAWEVVNDPPQTRELLLRHSRKVAKLKIFNREGYSLW